MTDVLATVPPGRYQQLMSGTSMAEGTDLFALHAATDSVPVPHLVSLPASLGRSTEGPLEHPVLGVDLLDPTGTIVRT